MEQGRNEDLRNRFRELAATVERIHDEWQLAAERDDVGAETRLIDEETAVLAELDQVVKEFKDRIGRKITRQ